jgi:uncharacterized protein
MSLTKRFPLRYFLVTFAWTWIVWSVLILMGLNAIPISATLRTALIYLGGAGPAVGALVSIRSLEGRSGLFSWLKGFLDFRWGWKAWTLPVVAYASIYFVAWLIPEFFGESRLPSAVRLSDLSFLPVYLLLMIAGGGGEEFGWRGYILDPLEERLGAWGGNVVLAAVWGLWHLPLWFIPGTNQSLMNYGAFLLGIVGSSFALRCFRVMAAKRNSASIWSHAMLNAFFPAFPLLTAVAGAPQPRFWVFAGLSFAVGVALMLQGTFVERKGTLAPRR